MKEQILTWLPASHLLSAGQLPPNSEVCCDHAVANSAGYSGVLIRNTDTGIYSLWTSTVTVSINQQYAQRIHELNKHTDPEPLTVREICASPNDVPGYDKDQYIDPEILAKVKGGSYAYCDEDGNYYRSGFGLRY